MSVKRLVVAIVVIAVLFIGRANARRSANREQAAEPQAQLAEGKYVPVGDEGLGAAVAIMIDNSGSMLEPARGEARPKFHVAREALMEMLATTDSFVVKQPGFPVKVGLFYFADRVHTLKTIQPYDRAALQTALGTIPPPKGGTAIGEAMNTAREALYRSGTIRKYMLVVTDGENTEGRSPRQMAHEIARRSEGGVRMYFVAFDIDKDKFSFLRDVRGEVLGAGNALALRASLDTIYRGKILAEAVDAGETLTKKP